LQKYETCVLHALHRCFINCCEEVAAITLTAVVYDEP